MQLGLVIQAFHINLGAIKDSDCTYLDCNTDHIVMPEPKKKLLTYYHQSPMIRLEKTFRL
jgi:hypothetical protein